MDQVEPQHYTKYGTFSPVDIIEAFDLPYHLGDALKYIVRFRDKGGIVDLKKACWFLDRYAGFKPYSILQSLSRVQHHFLVHAFLLWQLPPELESACHMICLHRPLDAKMNVELYITELESK